jgi:hydrogenase-4 membrane subunit HyfE
MSGTLAWMVVVLGLLVLVVRRRSLAVGIVTVQALLLVAKALEDASSPADVGAALALGARAVALGALVLFLVSRTREPRPVRSGVEPLARAGVGVALALALIWLVPEIGLGSRETERAVLALVAFGLATAATRRATLFQVLGIVLVENGLALAALELHGGSALIEFGVALDLVFVTLVAAVFHDRIFAEFGAGDTAALRSLRDHP